MHHACRAKSMAANYFRTDREIYPVPVALRDANSGRNEAVTARPNWRLAATKAILIHNDTSLKRNAIRYHRIGNGRPSSELERRVIGKCSAIRKPLSDVNNRTVEAQPLL